MKSNVTTIVLIVVTFSFSSASTLLSVTPLHTPSQKAQRRMDQVCGQGEVQETQEEGEEDEDEEDRAGAHFPSHDQPGGVEQRGERL